MSTKDLKRHVWHIQQMILCKIILFSRSWCWHDVSAPKDLIAWRIAVLSKWFYFDFCVVFASLILLFSNESTFDSFFHTLEFSYQPLSNVDNIKNTSSSQSYIIISFIRPSGICCGCGYKNPTPKSHNKKSLALLSIITFITKIEFKHR